MSLTLTQTQQHQPQRGGLWGAVPAAAAGMDMDAFNAMMAQAAQQNPPFAIAMLILLFNYHAFLWLALTKGRRRSIVLAISVFGLVAWLRRRDPVYGLAVRQASTAQRLGLVGLLLLARPALRRVGRLAR